MAVPFKAYLGISDQSQKSMVLRSELQSSGVSLVDCPHNDRKDVADKMIIVDMFAHAIDTPAPSTVMLITDDRDFAYAISTLRLRRYQVALVTLANAHASLTAQASVYLDWNTHVLNPRGASVKTSNHLQQASSWSVQEKLRPSGLLNPRGDLPEVDQYDETGSLEIISNATANRLAGQLSSNNNSIGSHGPSNQPSKERSTFPTFPSASSSGNPFDPPLGSISPPKSFIGTNPTTTTQNPYEHYATDNAKRSSHPFNTLDEPPNLDYMANQRDSFTQQPFNQNVLSNTRFPAHPDPPLPASANLLPPILTGSSSQSSGLLPSKGHVQPIQRPLAPSFGTPSTSYRGQGMFSQSTSRSFTKIASMPLLNSPQRTAIAPQLSFLHSLTEDKLQAPVIEDTLSPQLTLKRLTSLPPILSQNSSFQVIPHLPPGVPSSSNSASYGTGGYTNRYSAYTKSSATPGTDKPISGNVPFFPSQPAAFHNSSSVASYTSSNQSSPQQVLPPPPTPYSPFTRVNPLSGDSSSASLPQHAAPSTNNSRLETRIPPEPKPSLSTVYFPPSQKVLLPKSLPKPTGALSSINSSFTIVKNEPISGFTVAAPPRHRGTVVPEIFEVLVRCLEAHISKGYLRPLRGTVALQISREGTTYTRAGVTKFSEYVALAKQRGIVRLGGIEGGAWISLEPDWCIASPSTSTEVVKAASWFVEETVLPISSTPSDVTVSDSSYTSTTLPSTTLPSTPLQHALALSSPTTLSAMLKDRSGDFVSSAHTINPAPGTPFAEGRVSIAQPEPLSSINSSLLPGTFSIPCSMTRLASEVPLGLSDPPPIIKCTDEESHFVDTTPSALLITGPQLASSAPLTNIDIHMDSPAEPDVSVDSVPPLAASPSSSSEKVAAPSSPVCPPSNIGESAADASHCAPAPVESIPLPTIILQSQRSVSTTISSSQSIEGPSSSNTTLSATVKCNVSSGPILSVPSPVAQLQPAPSVPERFIILVECLQALRSKGIEQPLRSVVALNVAKNGSTYKKAGVESFAEYATLAKKKGIIELGGTGEKAWITLKPASSIPSPSQSEAPVAVPENFKVLVKCLQFHRSRGTYCPTRSVVSYQVNKNSTTYGKAGVTQFKHYISLAEKAGIVELGGEEDATWVRLKPQWYDAVAS